MNRRTFLSLPALGPAAAQVSRPPNVLVLLADDLGSGDLGYRGGEIRTPHLDRLAGDGVQFDRFYSYPVCSPTRSGLMTGRSSMRTGVIYSVIRPWSGYGVPLTEHFLPESFRAAGYQTAMTGKWHLGHARRAFLPNARGFEHSYGHLNGAIDYFTHIRDGGLDWHRNGRSVREEGYTTELIGAEAARVIRRRDRNRPLFLYVPFNAPHTPLQAPRALLDKYARIADPKRRAYAAMVEAMDSAVGRILGALEEERMSRDTLVLFFSDNGGPVNQGARNHSLRGAKGSTFEGGILAPAVMRWPGRLPAGGRSRQVMTVLDVFPTLAAAAGVRPRNRLPFDGKDLWPAITGQRVEPREDLFFAVDSGRATYLAVRRREWKLVREGETNFLFHIEDDPEEKRDLAAKRPEMVKDLLAALERWQALHPPDGVRHSGRPPAGFAAPAQWAEAAR
jgi:arylsulfatase A-like enzyme